MAKTIEKEPHQGRSELFTRKYRRPNDKHWEWMIESRRVEVRDAIFGWLEQFYISDSGSTKDVDWAAILSSALYANNWEGITADCIHRWGSRLNSKYVTDTLYAFEEYCAEYFGCAKYPVVPPYPHFDDFLQSRKAVKNKTKKR